MYVKICICPMNFNIFFHPILLSIHKMYKFFATHSTSPSSEQHTHKSLHNFSLLPTLRIYLYVLMQLSKNKFFYRFDEI